MKFIDLINRPIGAGFFTAHILSSACDIGVNQSFILCSIFYSILYPLIKMCFIHIYGFLIKYN